MDFLGTLSGKTNHLSCLKFGSSVIEIDIVISNCFIKSINFSGSECLVTTEHFLERKVLKSLSVALANCAGHSSNFIASC